MSRAAPTPRRRLALALATLVLAGALAGCAARGERDPELVQAVANTQAMSWEPGNFWAYRAVFNENTSIDVALVVHRVDPYGFHLGSNASAGFFGLPFTGNVTAALNPMIGPDEWPLYRFPLEDGKSWTYEMWGHTATTTAYAALIDVPGVGPTPGFTFESSSYGQVFARYDYSPVAGWFTRMELIEPTDGTRVLDVTLTAFGPDYGEAYYVEEAIKTVRVPCPAAPADVPIDIPAGYLRVHALLSAQAEAGAVDARLDNENGRALAQARALVKDHVVDRASVASPDGTWTLAHVCGGAGRVYLEVTGMAPIGPLAQAEAPPEGPELDMGALLQRTRPDLPQTGQVTSTGLPVAV